MYSGGGGGNSSFLGLSRTFNPKYTHYISDGNGRDTYIIRHNGGLCSEREPNFSESTRYTSPARYSYAPAPKKEVFSLKYTSDGSGRDSYILINSGGNHVEQVYGGKRPFHKTLRDESFIKPVLPSGRDSSRKRDFYYWQNWYLPQQQGTLRRSLSNQRNLTMRLNTPKYQRMRSTTPSTVASSQQNLNGQLKKSLIDLNKKDESKKNLIGNKSFDLKISVKRNSQQPHQRYYIQSQQITNRNNNNSHQRNHQDLQLNKSTVITPQKVDLNISFKDQTRQRIKAEVGKHFQKSLSILQRKIDNLVSSQQQDGNDKQVDSHNDKLKEVEKKLEENQQREVILQNLKDLIRSRKNTEHSNKSKVVIATGSQSQEK